MSRMTIPMIRMTTEAALKLIFAKSVAAEKSLFQITS